MSGLEMAQESLDHATKAHEYGSVPHAKRATIVIASLAAALALCEVVAKNGRASFLTHHCGIRYLDTVAGEVCLPCYPHRDHRYLVLAANAADIAVAQRRADALALVRLARSSQG